MGKQAEEKGKILVETVDREIAKVEDKIKETENSMKRMKEKIREKRTVLNDLEEQIKQILDEENKKKKEIKADLEKKRHQLDNDIYNISEEIMKLETKKVKNR